MITLAAKLVVVAIAGTALALAPRISRWIRERGHEVTAEAGTGDEPGSPDRGPDGIKM